MRKPAYLQITRKCNNECIFCSNPPLDEEYSLEEAKSRVLEFKKEGVDEILLTGGEPTLSPFLIELIMFIIEKEINPKIITNGVKLSERCFCDSLYEAGLRDLNISIHSHNLAIARRLSSKEDNPLYSMKGVSNALDAGLNVTINMTLNSLNILSLHKSILYLIRKFPQIRHYVFNNLDPGKSDGTNISRAGRNPWIVARFTEIELPLYETIKILERYKRTYRIERVPLCYMQGSEEFSTETRKIVKDEFYMCSFIDGEKDILRKVDPKFLRKHVEACSNCRLKGICAGVQEEYISLHGEGEFFPVFQDPEDIRKKILKSENLASKYGTELLHLRISSQCNNNCIFCMEKGNPLLRGISSHIKGILENIDESKNILKKNKSLDIVYFTGFEPTMSKNLLELSRYARELGYGKICIVTNGILVADMAQKLCEAGVNIFVVSLHAPSAEISSKISHSEKDFHKAVKALKVISKLKERKDLILRLNYTINRYNLTNMQDFVIFAESFDLDVLNFNTLDIRGMAAERFKEIGVRYSEVVKEFKPIKEKYPKRNISLSGVPECLANFKGESLVPVIQFPKKNLVKYYEFNHKKYLERCFRCKAYKRCSGIQIEYLNQFGDGEFKEIF